MTKEQMLKTIDMFQIKRYYVIEDSNGDFILQFGDNDPSVEIEKLKMDICVLKTQLRFAMSKLYNLPYDKTEDLIQ